MSNDINYITFVRYAKTSFLHRESCPGRKKKRFFFNIDTFFGVYNAVNIVSARKNPFLMANFDFKVDLFFGTIFTQIFFSPKLHIYALSGMAS